MNENVNFERPCGIDINEEKKLLYIADKVFITILNLELDKITSWKLPNRQQYYEYRGLKYDKDILYLTVQGTSEIYLCKSENGEVIKKFGTVWSGS